MVVSGSLCYYVIVCVVFVVLLVAVDALAVVWCSKKVQNEICNYKKYPAREIFPLQFYINSKKIQTALNYSHYSFILIRKKLNLHHVKSVIIFTEMVQLIFGNIALSGMFSGSRPSSACASMEPIASPHP